ncbi:hypothetical protein MASR2M41_02780 [Flammeovirgaceae bacterium]
MKKFLTFLLLALLVGCAVKQQPAEEENAGELEESFTEESAVESVPTTLFGKLKQEISRYQSEKNNGLNPDFNIKELLELPENYSRAEFMLVYEDSDSQIQFSLITFEGGKKIYYLASCSADGEKAVIAKVGETKEDSSYNYRIIAAPCHECDTNTWVVSESDKAIVVDSNPRVFNYLNGKFYENKDFAKPQAALNSLLNHFKLNKDSYRALVYTEQEEYSISSKSYFYAEDSLKYFFSDFGAEGGDGNQQLIRLERKENGDLEKSILLTSYQEEGLFSYVSNGTIKSYKVYPVDNLPPVIFDTTADRDVEYEKELENHWYTVAKNQSMFKLVNGQYEFYLKRDTVNSEYGLDEVHQKYLINNALFVDRILGSEK